MILRALLIALWLIAPFSLAVAEDPQAAPVTDSAQVSAHFHEVITRPEYQEIPDADIGSRLKDSLSQWFLQIGNRFGQFQYSGEMPAFASLLMTLLVILCVAGLLYVMVRLTRRRQSFEMETDTLSPGPKTFRPPESYDNEIQQAIREGNWHSAWLAAWRQFLSRLENRRLVEADRTRTNREYLEQLRAHSIPAPVMGIVAGMVDAYDRTIYGRKPIAEPDWNAFHQQIEEAALLLHLEEKRPVSLPRPREA